MLCFFVLCFASHKADFKDQCGAGPLLQSSPLHRQYVEPAWWLHPNLFWSTPNSPLKQPQKMKISVTNNNSDSEVTT